MAKTTKTTKSAKTGKEAAKAAVKSAPEAKAAPASAKANAPLKSQADPAGQIFVGRSEKDEVLTLSLANRHGLVTGATGTGKTVTLQVLAEGFSRAGVPVFAADIKGDLSGIAAAGRGQGCAGRARQGDRLQIRSRSVPGRSSGICSASRATRSARPSPKWGRCCWRGCWTSTKRRKACSTSPSGSPTRRAAAARSQGSARDARRDLAARGKKATEGTGSVTRQGQADHGIRNVTKHRSAPSSASCWCSRTRAARSSSASRRSTSRT